MIRKLTQCEFKQATELSLKVFTQCNAADFNAEVGYIYEQLIK